MSMPRLNKILSLGVAIAALTLAAAPAQAHKHQWYDQHRQEVVVETPRHWGRPQAHYWTPSHRDWRHHRYERYPYYAYPSGRDRDDRWSRRDRYDRYPDRWAGIGGE